MALSNSKIKYIRSLNEKKHRNAKGTFLAEGKKLVSDLLSTCKCQLIVALPEYINEFQNLNVEELIEANSEEIKKASLLKTAPSVLGVFYKNDLNYNDFNLLTNIHLALDGIRDPGNMGTIIRIADWFGIEHIFCSHDTVDIYNPKTIQATMGAIARVNVHYTDLKELFSLNKDIPVYGTFLDGDIIYEADLSNSGFILMGNEGVGISKELEEYISNRLYIPNYPQGKSTSESLNVAIATAIVCSEFRRK